MNSQQMTRGGSFASSPTMQPPPRPAGLPPATPPRQATTNSYPTTASYPSTGADPLTTTSASPSTAVYPPASSFQPTGSYNPAAGSNQSAATSPTSGAHRPADFYKSPGNYQSAANYTPAATGGPKGQSRRDTKLNLSNPTQIVARVGDQPILLGDLLGEVNQLTARYEGQVPAAELDRQKEKLIRQLLEVKIDTKLLYLDFLRELPPEADLEEIEKNVTNVFNDKQLSALVEKAEVNTPGEYDLHLRKYGSSLDKMRKAFIEQVIAFQARAKNIDKDPEITHQEMLEHYRGNLKEYEISAKVRWEQLSARFARFNSHEDAWRAIATMGNEVQGGAPFHAVARRSSQGFRAKDGGQHDWTTQGSLSSEALNEALAELPPNKLSWIIKDDVGYHIIRVLGRKEATYIPFTEAQVDIKKSLRAEKIEAQQQEYLAGLRERTPYWTIFDEQKQVAEQKAAPPGGEFNLR